MATLPKTPTATFNLASSERSQIDIAIAALNRVKVAKTEQQMIVAAQAAYSQVRQLIRGRLD